MRICIRLAGMNTSGTPPSFRVSTSSAEALRCVDEAIASLLAHRGGVDAWVAEALRHDPDCVAAHCVGASASLLAADAPRSAGVDRALTALLRLASKASDRERRHIAALLAWHRGDMRIAVERYGALLRDDPHDSLALVLAHALDFRLGNRAELRDRVAAVLPHRDAEVDHFGHVLAMYAFGLEENGELARAEALARRSLDLVADNAAAIHVIAHVFEMQGRAAEGIEWLEATRGIWSANRGFAAHIAWHLALFHVDLDDTRAALAVYDASLHPSPSASTAALVDASALLWRLSLRGADVGARWSAVAKAWRRKPLHGMRAFNLVHAVIAFAGARRRRSARRVIAMLRRDTATRSANPTEDLDLAIPVCEALVAFADGDYRLAVDRLALVRAMAERCGGSVAQCDLILLTLLEAALRGHRIRLAHALAAERTARRPGSLLNRWFFARAGATAPAL